MRWMKHMTDAADDEKLADILTEFGPEGYGVWWLMVEVVGKQMDSTDRCEASYSLEHWARKLYISKRKTSNFLGVFSEKNLISLEYDNKSTVGKIIVKIPNMLKFRDEYSKKSGQTPDKTPDSIRTKIQKQKQKQNTEKEKPLQVHEVRELYTKYSGRIQDGNGQVVVLQDIARKYTRAAVIEAFGAAAGANVSAAGFLNWCVKRLERGGASEPVPRKREFVL